MKSIYQPQLDALVSASVAFLRRMLDDPRVPPLATLEIALALFRYEHRPRPYQVRTVTGKIVSIDSYVSQKRPIRK